MKITLENLQAKVDRINRMTGMPLETYTKDANGKFSPCAGNYHLDGAYGGYALSRMDLTVGCSGVSNVFRCGHVTKRALADRLDAFINGLEAKQQPSTPPKIMNKNEMKATDRPWQTITPRHAYPVIVDASGVGIAKTDLSISSGNWVESVDEAQANAKLIVTAVNEYEALKAVEVAAKRAKYLLACNFYDLKKSGLHQSLEVQESRELISRALDNLQTLRATQTK